MRIASCLSGLLLIGCASTPPKPTVIADAARKIGSGDVVSYKLEPGRYHLELTASHDGLRVEWLGASCSQARLIKQLNTDCELRQTGQLVLENPAALPLGNLGFGQAVNATIRLTRLP